MGRPEHFARSVATAQSGAGSTAHYVAGPEVIVARTQLIANLHQLRNIDGGWPYFPGRNSRLEPTCWALLATGSALTSTPLGKWQRADGFLVEPSTGAVNIAFNALAILCANGAGGGPAAMSDAVVNALLESRGDAAAQHPQLRQDSSLQAWSWTTGAFSWVEPTAWALLALKLWATPSAAVNARIATGERVMRDRACPGGGWNYGNAEVYGKALPGHVPPTAIGIMALQDRVSEPVVGDAVAFIERQALLEGSTTALALSQLALSAVGRVPSRLVDALVAHTARTEAFGNIASIAMAAYALGCAQSGTPSAFKLGKEPRG